MTEALELTRADMDVAHDAAAKVGVSVWEGSMPDIDSTDYHDFVIKDGTLIGDFEQMYRRIDDPWGTVRHAQSLKNDLVVALVRHVASQSPVTRVLHAGCALGALTARVRDALGAGVEITGCDISVTAVEKAAARHRDIRFLVQDLAQVEALPLAPGSLDLIVMAETMWYVLPFLGRLLRGFRMLLRPGGHLVMQQFFPQPGEQTYGREIVAAPDDLLRFITEAGFAVGAEAHLDPRRNHSMLVWATAP